MAVDVGSAKGYLDLDISGFLAGLKSAQSEADLASKNIATKIGNNLSSVGKSLTTVGTSLTKYVTVPLATIGTAGLKVATDFEKGMSEVKAISGSTGKEFDALREKAIELGADTAFSAGEVAEAMVEMAKAGWNSEQIIDGMSGVLAAAAASGEGLASVSTIVADAITGFGLEASESTKVADLLTQAANSGTIGITDLGETFKYIAPVAGAMGLSIEDVTTAVSAMSMAGIKGSQAGTVLRTMLTNLVNPSDEAAAALKALGISATNNDGSMKSLDEIVGNLRTSFDGLTEAEKAQYAAVIAGKTGMSGMLALLNLTEEEYNAIAESMDNAGGVAEETATIMQDNLQSKVEQLGGALESLAIKLADYVIPYIQEFVIWLTGLVDKFTALDPEMQKSILKFAGLAAVIGPILIVIGKLVSSIGGLFTAFGKIPGIVSKVSSGFTKLITGCKNIGEGFTLAKAGFSGLASASGSFGAKIGAAIAGITGPMIAITAVVAVVIAAFVSLWKNNEEFRNKMIAIWNQIKETFNNFTQGIVDRLNALGFDFESIGEVFKTIWDSIVNVLKTIWEGFCNFLAPIFEAVFQQISNIFTFITDQILAVFDFWVAIFQGDWEGAWNAVKSVFENIWNFIVDTFNNIGNMLLGILDTICGWFGTTWEETWTSIKTFFVNIWEGITTWFQNALNNIATFFTNLWNGIVSFFTGVWEGIKNVVQVGIMFIASLLDAAFQIITLPFRFIWENCKDTIISVWESIKTTVTNALNAISNFIKNVWNSIKAFLEPILNGIKTTVTNVWNGIKDKISTAVNAIKTTVTNIFNSVKTVVTNVFNSIKTTTSTIWNNIKSSISTSIENAKAKVNTVVDNIKSKFSSGFNEAKNTVSNVFDNIKKKIEDIMDGAKRTISTAIDKIKGLFDFSWSFPPLKLPHFSITGSFSLNPPSVPKLSIEWYKKAMNGGMILNSPTIFGYNSATGQFLGAGEAGSETVVGTASLMKMIQEAVNNAIKPILDGTFKLARVSEELGYIFYNGFSEAAKSRLDDSVEGLPDKLKSGDTFNFYSPKAIDEIEAAKQMKKTKRELAEGF